jgi:hypothetical protein
MEPEIKQQPEESHAPASKPTEIMPRQRARLRSAVGRIAIRVGNWLERFFYDPDAFRFKGIMTLVLQLLGVLGVGISLQFLARPASVVVENREPIACFDATLFEESYALRKLTYPQHLRDAIGKVGFGDWPNTMDQLIVGAVARGLPLDPGDVSHRVLCWYVNPRSAERLEEIGQLKAAMRRSSQQSPYGVISRIEWAKRMARAEDELIDTRRQREFSAHLFLDGLTDFSTPAKPLNLAVVLKPWESESRYRNPTAWEEDVRIVAIEGLSVILKAIDGSGLQGNDLALAFEQFDHVRCFLNWVEVSTTSTHAVAPKVSIAIARRPGQSLVLGGTLQLNENQSHFTGTIEKLLPRERLWALLRTSRPIRTSDIEIVTDPTAFFDPHSVWKVVPIIGLIVLAWTVANVRARCHEPRLHFLSPSM